MTRHRITLGLALLSVVAALGATSPAAAEPATSVSYPAAASATRLTGLAFDACDAPTTSTMRAWTSSPYDGLGVCIGGVERTCGQRNLNSAWVSAVSVMGWRLIPIWMGHQAPCTYRADSAEFTSTTAESLGTSNAVEAVRAAKALGMLPGSAIYGDVEHYVPTDAGCRTAVLRYVSSWTKELHRQGYLAGVYAHLYSGAKHLSESYGSTSYARPDAIWIARWDLSSSLSNWAGVSNANWANHQRGKQYRGDHDETYNGVRINIDSDRFDAPVATVAYAHRSTTSLNARTGPSTSYPIAKNHASGATLNVVCQTPGLKVGTTSVWDKLSDGTYVTDYYVNTRSKTSYSAPLPRCTYPYQVITSTAKERTAPSDTATVVRTLPSGALGWVYCQRSGSKAGTTSVWDRLDTGNYVTDYKLATPSKTTYSKPVPRC